MTIQFSCEKLMLSPSSFELLGSPDPIGIAVVRTLISIDTSVRQLDLTPYRELSGDPTRDACSINYLATLPMRIYKDLLAWEGTHSGFSRSEIVDGWLKAGHTSLLPAIRMGALIAGKSEAGILASYNDCRSYSWQRFTSDGFPVREGESRQESGMEPETYQMPYGILIKRWRGENSYWYWQYYRSDGSRAETYMHKRLDEAISRVKRIGIPGDAKPQRLNKSKKIYQINA